MNRRAHRPDRTAKPLSDRDLKKWSRFVHACQVAVADPASSEKARKLVDARKATRNRPMPSEHYRPDSPLYQAWKLTEIWGALGPRGWTAKAPELAGFVDGLALAPVAPKPEPKPDPTRAVRRRRDIDDLDDEAPEPWA